MNWEDFKMNTKYYNNIQIYAGDLETTTYNNETWVWACGLMEITDNPVHEEFRNFKYLDDMLDYVADNKPNSETKIIIYFHNLAFDGSFVLNNLLNKGYKNRMKKGYCRLEELKTLISESEYYKINFCWVSSNGNKTIIELRDSMKILNFKLSKIAKDLKTKFKKLTGEIDYSINRPAGWEITEEEYNYLFNDVAILAEALEKIKEYGLLEHTTIASVALNDYKNRTPSFKYIYPQLEEQYDQYIRASYRGGICYVNPEIAGRIINGEIGIYDVNSLYPSRMNSDDIFPVGKATYIECEEQYEYLDYMKGCYFVRLQGGCEVKPGHLPFLQKRNVKFGKSEFITKEEDITITLSSVDYELFNEHYVNDMCILDMVVFKSYKTGKELFGEYVNYWAEQKIKASEEGNATLRLISKLMMNALYGKFGSRSRGICKIPYLEDNIIKYDRVEENRNLVYLPVAAYITSYARKLLVDSIMKIGLDRFLYCDTDSMHILIHELNVNSIIEVHSSKLGAWAKEGVAKKAKYLRQKTYLEILTEKDNEPTYKIDLKCAGMPENVKDAFLKDRTEDEVLKDFEIGLRLSGKLQRKQISGGVALFETDYVLRAL